MLETTTQIRFAILHIPSNEYMQYSVTHAHTGTRRTVDWTSDPFRATHFSSLLELDYTTRKDIDRDPELYKFITVKITKRVEINI